MISNISLTDGVIDVTADNVTIRNTEIITGNGTMGANWAIYIAEGVTGTKVLHTTMRGTDCQSGSLFAGVWNTSNDSLVMDHDYAACVDDILHGSGMVTNTYSIDNANIPGDHYEPIAYDGGSGGITLIHDTLINTHEQTAAVFVTCQDGPVTSETIENSLLAGGDYVLYGPTGNGPCDSQTGRQVVVNNRFSRQYFRKGGFYGVATAFQAGNTTWSGNVWDDTLRKVRM
ncbi:MAG: hypothetical protein ACYCXW_15170 [Solirubrobacteraceae bacterium]